jgi:hypothetical protein
VSRKPDESDDAFEHARGRVAIEPSGSPADEPPVVARLVVEIRSDGRRTIARGALEDLTQGERVAVEARGDSPLSLALGLARSILSMPMLARASARKLLGGLGRAGGRSGGSGRGPGQE